jgi:hypothetical protein
MRRSRPARISIFCTNENGPVIDRAVFICTKNKNLAGRERRIAAIERLSN